MTPDEAIKHPWLNQTSSTFELTRCSSQETPTPTHKSSSSSSASSVLASTRSESDLPGSSSLLPPPPPPPLPGDAYSLYRVYKGTRKVINCSKERLSSADALERRSQNRTGSMQRESSLPEKSTLDDSGTFLPPIL